MDSLSELREFQSSTQLTAPEPTIERCEIECRARHANFVLRSRISMSIFLKGTDKHVGVCSLKDFDWSVPKCEIGYWGRTTYSRQDFITAAVRGLTDFAFQHLHMRRVQALVDEENVRSCRVCERAGFQHEGTLRHEQIAPTGDMRNTRVYACVR